MEFNLLPIFILMPTELAYMTILNITVINTDN